MQIRGIQILRGAAAVAVLLCHIHNWELKNLGARALTPEIFNSGFVGVDLFFVISGFIMVYIQPLPLDSRSSYLRFIINRFTRIYPPFWIVMLVLLPFWLARPQLFSHSDGHPVDVFRSFFLLPQDHQPMLFLSWTMVHELYFYLVVSFALLLAPPGRWVFGWVWFAVVLVGFEYFVKYGFHQMRVLQLVFSPFSLTFLLGYFIGLLNRQIAKFSQILSLALLGGGIIGLATGLAVTWSWSIGTYPNNNHLFRFVAYGLPAALLVASAVALESRLPRAISRFDFFGDISYATYLVHLPMVIAFYMLMARLNPTSPVLIFSAAIICFAGCLATSALFHYYLELKTTRKCRELLESIFHVQKPARPHVGGGAK